MPSIPILAADSATLIAAASDAAAVIVLAGRSDPIVGAFDSGFSPDFDRKALAAQAAADATTVIILRADMP